MDHRSGPALALTFSVAVHALVLGAWADGATRQPRKTAPAGATRAIAVRLRAAPALVAQAPVTQVPPLAPIPTRSPKKVRKAAVIPTEVTTAAAEAPTPSPPAVPPPTEAPSATAFAGLFAPVISRPLGRAGWGRTTAEPRRPPDEPAPPLPPEQALSALRGALLERLHHLGSGIAADRQALHCEISVDGKRRLAEIRCDDPADRAAPWGALQDLLAAGPVEAQEADLCFTLRPAGVAAIACAAIESVAGR